MAKRIRIGDLIEIPTNRGFAYGQYTHHTEKYGPLLRVFPGFHASPPQDYCKIATQTEIFVLFFPLQAAVNRNIVRVIGNCEVSTPSKEFPTFRSGLYDMKTGKVQNWWLWDGTRSWRVSELTSEQYKFPVEGIWNDTILIERLESGWRPSNEEAYQP